MQHGEPSTGAIRRALIVALVALGLLATGCTSSDETASGTTTGPDTETTLEPEGPVKTGGQLVFGIPAETAGWNPAVNQWADAANFVGSTFFETLMVAKPDGTAEPFLAESVEPVDGTEFAAWRIVLRDGVRFHDGTPMDADAVARSLTFTYSDPASLTAVATRDNFQSATAVDPRTVELRFREGWSALPSSLSITAGIVMAPAMLDAPDFGASNPIGTGPFRFEDWQRDASLTVVRNDDYWGEPAPLDAMRFEVMKDSTTRARALEEGEIDMMLTHTAQDNDTMGESGFTVLRDYESEKTFVMLNASTPPFDNEHARRAMALATDRAALTARLGQGIPLSSSPYVSTTLWALPEEESGYPEYDLAKAKEEVAAYLADTGQDALRVEFIGLSTLEEQQLMEVLQEQWAQAGIEAKVTTYDQTAYVATMVTGGFQAAYWRSYSYTDPDTNYVFWHDSTINPPGQLSLNFSRWSTPEISDALVAARLTDHLDARKKAYHEVAKWRNEAVIDVWLFNSPTALIASPDVRGLNGFRTNPFANYIPKPWINDLWLDRGGDVEGDDGG